MHVTFPCYNNFVMTKLDMSLIMCFVFNMYFENKNDGIFQTKSNEIGLFRVRNNFPLMLR
jgi:hypothetical protein